jgi:hypothetical protein
MKKNDVISAITRMQQSGLIRNRRDCLVILGALQCRTRRIERHQITAYTVDGEKVIFRGYAFSLCHNTMVQKSEFVLLIVMLLSFMASVVTRVGWVVIFHRLSNDDAFWSTLPESMRSAINIWGYAVPATFTAVAMASLGLLALIQTWLLIRWLCWMASTLNLPWSRK